FLQEEMERQQKEIERQKQVFRGGGGLPELKGKTVILADDGLATGHTMLAAVKAAIAEGAERVIVAVPVGPPDTIKKLKDVADDVVYITSPEHFFAVGHFYRDFRQVTDEEVKAKLEKPNVTKVL
ncbi:MAG: phosphoribosyltransferase family protein, partial [Dehalococcoidia bacterium]|nr:phosphoribosyltransferase family protein [Dehalococcoidia bacterium]